ncbi:MAG: polyprenyl synthetase family protein [Gammaproteobacteria bacterium]|nr:polyprenyl synthetase family protein [Gammaproteobacteria bacterium]
MTQREIELTLDDIRELIGNALVDQLPRNSEHSEQLVRAIAWGVLGGGKRLRGTLVYTVSEGFSTSNIAGALDFAVAIELMHSYSLIHDDLPSMDDADLRRGKPSTHKKFGAAMATLAGDALQALAFDVIANSKYLSSSQIARGCKVLAVASGWRGMVGGQAWDISDEQPVGSESELSQLHQAKTGELFKAAILLGLIAGDQDLDPDTLEWGEKFGMKLGWVFQMVDDVIDVTQSSDTTGKPALHDDKLGKITYPQLLGMEGTLERIECARKELKQFLKEKDLENSLLDDLVWRCIDRVA